MTELGGLTGLAGPRHRPAGWGVDSPVTLGTPCRRGTGRATTTPRLVPTISRPWQTSRLVTQSRWCPGQRERGGLARCHAGWAQTCQTAQRVLPSPVTPHLPRLGYSVWGTGHIFQENMTGAPQSLGCCAHAKGPPRHVHGGRTDMGTKGTGSSRL